MLTIGVCAICIVIALIIISIGVIATHGALLYIIYAANGVFVEKLTSKLGKRASENSATFGWLVFSLITSEILLLAWGVFCIYVFFYRLITGQPLLDINVTAPSNNPTTLSVLAITLLVIDSALILKYVCQLFMLHKTITVDTEYYKNLASVVISYALCSSYLIAVYYFVNNNLSGNSLGLLASIAGCVFFPYMLVELGKAIYHHIKYRKQIYPNLTLLDKLSFMSFIVFDFLFMFFFYKTAQYLWFLNV